MKDEVLSCDTGTGEHLFISLLASMLHCHSLPSCTVNELRRSLRRFTLSTVITSGSTAAFGQSGDWIAFILKDCLVDS